MKARLARKLTRTPIDKLAPHWKKYVWDKNICKTDRRIDEAIRMARRMKDMELTGETKSKE